LYQPEVILAGLKIPALA
jgi:hypothetical protein